MGREMNYTITCPECGVSRVVGSPTVREVWTSAEPNTVGFITVVFSEIRIKHDCEKSEDKEDGTL